MKRASLILLAFVAFVGLSPQAKAGIVTLGTAGNYAVLGGQTVTNTGPTVLTGDLGVSPGSAITGFFGTTANDGPGLVFGAIHQADAVALQAQSDLTTAYNLAAGAAVTANQTGIDLGGLTLTPGVYFFSSSAQLTGTLTLDFQGDSEAEFIFQIGSTLTTASSSSVLMTNIGSGLTPGCEVYWQVGSSATLGTGTDFVGHILALTSISLNNDADIIGSALARNGSVTLINNDITNINCLTGQSGEEGGTNSGVVPEPSMFLIFGSLLAGLFGFRKRFLSAA